MRSVGCQGCVSTRRQAPDATPLLLVLGLLTRAAALVLLGMTIVIEVFVWCMIFSESRCAFFGIMH